MSILPRKSDPVGAESSSSEPDSWQRQMKLAIRDIDSLLERLGLADQAGPDKGPKEIGSLVTNIGAKATSTFPVFVPIPFLSRMKPGDFNDPLLRQVLPVSAEDDSPENFSDDPLAESDSVLTPGLLQKYKGRVLMITTGACAVHCRYCFRRHYPYQESPNSNEQWQSAIDEIAADDSIEEVILSGGDPLTIVDSRIRDLIVRLGKIKHLKRLRIHSRLPIMIPQRVTDELVEMLQSTRLQSILVIHSNHANELDDAVKESLARLRDAGVLLLNQTVLLRDINSDAATLVALSKRLLECGVMPYYLHQVDPVIGVSHFEVDPKHGVELIAKMRAELPGYAVPRYVKELAGEPNKSVWA